MARYPAAEICLYMTKRSLEERNSGLILRPIRSPGYVNNYMKVSDVSLMALNSYEQHMMLMSKVCD
jgi:hypothetical protein